MKHLMKYEFEYEVYNSVEQVGFTDQQLIQLAYEASKNAYAPYSNFRVGAAAVTNAGNIITGSNQENGSYSATICAERVLLAALSSTHHGEHITTLAVNYIDQNGLSTQPISPCGVCRQAILEHEIQFQCELRIILSCTNGPIYIINKSKFLLPLPFKL